MDLDNLKEKVQHMKAPASAAAGGGSDTAVSTMLTLVRETDTRQLAKLRKARRLFAITTAIFLLAFFVSLLDSGTSDGQRERDLLLRGSIAVIYVFVTVTYGIGVRKLARIDYTESVVRFLRNAENRYRFMSPSDLILAVFGLLFIIVVTGVGYIPYLKRTLGFVDAVVPMELILSAFIIITAGLGTFFTHRNWNRDRAPVWRRIREMLKELERE